MRVQLPPEPWANNYQRQADDATNMALYATDEEWRELQPPLPQIEYLPPRFGYLDYADRQPTVISVFGINRLQPAGLPPTRQAARQMKMTGADRVNYSGTQGGTNGGSPRNENYSAMGMGG